MPIKRMQLLQRGVTGAKQSAFSESRDSPKHDVYVYAFS